MKNNKLFSFLICGASAVGKLLVGCSALLTAVEATAADLGKPVTWDRHSLMIDGRRVCPVMGEVH